MHNIQGVKFREGLPHLFKVAELVYFDGPLLSQWRDPEGNNYLYYWCDVDENYNRWLVLPVPSEMLEGYLCGEEVLRTLIKNPIGERAYLVDIDSNGNERKVKKIAVSDLPEDYLPSEDSYYDPELAMLEETEDTEAELSFLPSNTLLGKLRIIEVLNEPDEPHFFIVENASGNYYIVFQVYDLETETLWLYASVSESRIEEVMRGKITLRQIYTEPEDEILFKVCTSDRRETIVEPIKPAQLEPNLLLPLEQFSLPQKSFFAEEALVGDSSDGTDHEIIINRPKAKKATPFESLASVATNWSQLIHAFLGVPPVSVDISLGSLKVKLRTEAGNQLPNFFKVLGNLIQSPTAQLIRESLSHEERKRLELLLTSLQQYKLTLYSKIAFDEIQYSVELSHTQTKELKSILLDINSQNVDSIEVPQADDLDKVFKIVELVREGETNLDYHLALSPRQVRYYQQAAKILDLLSNIDSVTSRGLFFLNLPVSKRYKMALLLFESSSVGFAWLRFCAVSSALELNPESAENFLRSQDINLSITTLKRRARTLACWVTYFQLQLQEQSDSTII